MGPIYGTPIEKGHEEIGEAMPMVLGHETESVGKEQNRRAEKLISRSSIFRSEMHRRHKEQKLKEENSSKTPNRRPSR